MQHRPNDPASHTYVWCTVWTLTPSFLKIRDTILQPQPRSNPTTEFCFRQGWSGRGSQNMQIRNHFRTKWETCCFCCTLPGACRRRRRRQQGPLSSLDFLFRRLVDFSVQALRLESKRVGVSRRASLYYSLAIIRINTKLEGGRRRETGDERGEKVLLLNGCLQNIFTHWWMKLLAEVICEWKSVILSHNLLWNWNVKFYDWFFKTQVIFR